MTLFSPNTSLMSCLAIEFWFEAIFIIFWNDYFITFCTSSFHWEVYRHTAFWAFYHYPPRRHLTYPLPQGSKISQGYASYGSNIIGFSFYRISPLNLETQALYLWHFVEIFLNCFVDSFSSLFLCSLILELLLFGYCISWTVPVILKTFPTYFSVFVFLLNFLGDFITFIFQLLFCILKFVIF